MHVFGRNPALISQVKRYTWSKPQDEDTSNFLFSSMYRSTAYGMQRLCSQPSHATCCGLSCHSCVAVYGASIDQRMTVHFCAVSAGQVPLHLGVAALHCSELRRMGVQHVLPRARHAAD